MFEIRPATPLVCQGPQACTSVLNPLEAREMHLQDLPAAILDPWQETDIITEHGDYDIRPDLFQRLGQTAAMTHLFSRVLQDL